METEWKYSHAFNISMRSLYLLDVKNNNKKKDSDVLNGIKVR